MRPDEMETADRSKPYLFHVQTDVKPGKIVCHVIRLETYEFERTPELELTKFDVLNTSDDPRLAVLCEAFHLIHHPPAPPSLS